MPSEPARKFVVCLDGTWNEVQSRTNVVRVFECLAQDDAQSAYYDEGVGVPKPEDPWLWRLRDQLNGGVFGAGLLDNVMRAWRWLAERYDRSRGDTVALLGFSRGAYTARVLAGLVVDPGLPGGMLECDALDKLATAVGDYRASGKPADKRPAGLAPVDVSFLGVWDTVGSLGVPTWNLWPLTLGIKRLRFIDTLLPDRILVARHAIAVDEYRRDYSPVLWTPRPGTPAAMPERDVQQVWFAGAHAQVGGGYLEDLLSEIPLAWMCREAAATGIRFRTQPAGQTPTGWIPERFRLDGREYLAPTIDAWRSFIYGLYRWLSPRNVRQIGTVGINEEVHDSVWLKWANDPDYRPPNIAHLGRTDVGACPEVTIFPAGGDAS